MGWVIVLFDCGCLGWLFGLVVLLFWFCLVVLLGWCFGLLAIYVYCASNARLLLGFAGLGVLV